MENIILQCQEKIYYINMDLPLQKKKKKLLLFLVEEFHGNR